MCVSGVNVASVLEHVYVLWGGGQCCLCSCSCVGGNVASVYVHVDVLVCQCCLCSFLCARRVNSGSVHVNVHVLRADQRCLCS